MEFNLPSRTQKPRKQGLTCVVDNGLPVEIMRPYLELSGNNIDVYKLGWGTACLQKNLREKLDILKAKDIRPCLGGMMFELAYWQVKLDDFIPYLREMGLELVEVSNGSLPIAEHDKNKMIAKMVNAGFTVYAEVGSKDIKHNSPPEQWIQSIKDDLQQGAQKVILEGRADASAGVYHADGTIKDELIQKILDSDIDVEKLIFEAPKKTQQVWFIEQVGANANFGNIPLSEVLNLESLRLGLRGDTVKLFNM